MVRSPRCARHGALATAPTRSARREPEPAARAGPRKEKKRKKKKGGGEKRGVKGHRRRGRGRGPEAASSRQKIPRKGEGSPLSSSRHPHPTPPIIWKLLPTSSGTSDTPLHFQADKAPSRGNPGFPVGTGQGPRAPGRPAFPDPLRTAASLQRAPGAALRSARLVLRWSPYLDMIYFLFCSTNRNP